MSLTWNDYIVTFHTDRGTERDDLGHITRFIRAVSQRDAEWRVVRKFILPADAEIVKVERV
jgi:hypothetical protein